MKLVLSTLLKSGLAFSYFLFANVSIAKSVGMDFWQKVEASSFNVSQERKVFPEQFTALHLDLSALRTALALAPKEGEKSFADGLQLSFPMPDGSVKTFSILETVVMHPLLAAKYPLIKTYIAKGMDDPYAWMRLDVTYLGFNAMISTSEGMVFIDPVNNTEPENYLCYYRKNMPDAYYRHCEFDSKSAEEERVKKEIYNTGFKKNLEGLDTGDELRTYRLALACTGEYAATKGGTVSGALSGMVTSVNRVNGIYEKEVAVRMILIANTDTLIFLNAGSDPYTNNSGGTMLGENQTTISNLIGNPNYDFGHVFSTGGGGIAGLGVICDGSQKAHGVTGLPNPVGDPFDVDYVAHEMGHQFSGNHTFNSNSQGSCAGNASLGHNYEPGSGSTIMAYAGICGSHDLQNHSDPFFHTESYNEIFSFTIFGPGNSCPLITFTNNSAPALNPLSDYIIPFKTPFMLTGSASDPDGDALTYIWEQFDFGPFGAPNSPSGNAPTFRDFTPSTDSTRTFPKLSSIINNINTNGERLPTYARTMHFKFTARDNRIAGGGVANNFTPVVVDVINTVNPFLVTVPNANTVVWEFGATELVTWDVSSTDLAPINCANVNIRLSLDGGFTFPYLLAANTPNDGLDSVVVSGTFPNVNTTLARIKVEAAGNIFFDMSNANFSIQIPNSISNSEWNQSSIQLFPNPIHEKIQIELSSGYTGQLVFAIKDCLGREIQSTSLLKHQTVLPLSIDLSALQSGVYFVEVSSQNSKISKRFVKL